MIGVCLSLQTGAPPAQPSEPSWQRLVGEQLAPSLQATHAPFAHTMPGALLHSEPSGAFPAQLVRPTLQSCMRSQSAPSAQLEQVPFEHTMFVPHVKPLDCSPPVSVQVCTPPAQAVRPT